MSKYLVNQSDPELLSLLVLDNLSSQPRTFPTVFGDVDGKDLSKETTVLHNAGRSKYDDLGCYSVCNGL